MKSKIVLKILGIGASLVGLAASAVSDLISKKEQKIKIEETINKAIEDRLGAKS